MFCIHLVEVNTLLVLLVLVLLFKSEQLTDTVAICPIPEIAHFRLFIVDFLAYILDDEWILLNVSSCECTHTFAHLRLLYAYRFKQFIRQFDITAYLSLFIQQKEYLFAVHAQFISHFTNKTWVLLIVHIITFVIRNEEVTNLQLTIII